MTGYTIHRSDDSGEDIPDELYDSGSLTTNPNTWGGAFDASNITSGHRLLIEPYKKVKLLLQTLTMVPKRKFNSLLNQLGSKSNSSDTIDEDETGLIIQGSTTVKRARIASLGSSAVYAGSRKFTPVQKIIETKKDVGGIKSTDEPATYVPWDQDSFFRRLQTFNSLTNWTPKPDEVNEVAWAKRGWICKGMERLQCVSCNTEFLCKLNRKEAEGTEQYVTIAASIDEALAGKYAEMIITKHADDCPWRERGCRDDILRLRLSNPAVVLNAIKRRYKSLVLISDKLPYEHNLQAPKDFNLDVVLEYLTKAFLTSLNVPTTATESASADKNASSATVINRVALQLALFGFEARLPITQSLGVAQCSACFRSLGLWMYRSKKVDENGNMVEPPDIPFLNGDSEHRNYCTYKSQNSMASAKSELSGWQAITQTLKNEAYLRQRETASDSPTAKSQPATVFNGELEDDDTKSIRDEEEKKRFARFRKLKNALFSSSLRKK